MELIIIGTIFRHFKGKYYIIEGFEKDVNTQEEIVVYRALYGNKEIHKRTLNDFTAQVDINREDNITKQKRRFEKVAEYKD